MSSQEFVDLPQPDQLAEREKEDGMGAYLMMFAAFAVVLPLPVVNLIAALIYYFINRKKSRFIHFHCLQSFLSKFLQHRWIGVCFIGFSKFICFTIIQKTIFSLRMLFWSSLPIWSMSSSVLLLQSKHEKEISIILFSSGPMPTKGFILG